MFRLMRVKFRTIATTFKIVITLQAIKRAYKKSSILLHPFLLLAHSQPSFFSHYDDKRRDNRKYAESKEGQNNLRDLDPIR